MESLAENLNIAIGSGGLEVVTPSFELLNSTTAQDLANLPKHYRDRSEMPNEEL